MSSVAVFVFLLDNLTGFSHAMNDTLLQNSMYRNSEEVPVIQDCDPFTTDQILSAVSKDLDLVIVPSFIRHQQSDSGNVEEMLDTVLVDNSRPEPDVSRSFDENKSKFDNDFTSFSKTRFRGSKKITHELKNETKMEFPKKAPFMVAIFETLENVTAQTCAGTLLSSRWVLTAANCINVLSNLHTNNTNITGTSHYTVVAESSDPLMDGSAHNVTMVVLPPASNSSRPAIDGEDSSFLALMKIEPEVEGPALELMKGEVGKGDVMAYGWVVSRNESDPKNDSMSCKSVLSQILSPSECQAMYSYKDNEVLCLLSKENVTELNTGGPVLYIHDGKLKLLAVVQADQDVFVSYPIAPYYDWILHTISNK